MKTRLSLSFLLTVAAAPLNGAVPDFVYIDISAGNLMGRYQAYEPSPSSPNPPSYRYSGAGALYYQYGRNISRLSPSFGIGIRFAPWIALEEEYDALGTYNFDNVYAYPAGSITEFEHNLIEERLKAAATRAAFTLALSRHWRLVLAPGVEHQFLRQRVTPWQWYTSVFSLPQIVPDPYAQTFEFWRPDFDSRLSYSLGAHFSAFAGYRFLESPGKCLSRLSGGVGALF